MTAEWIGHDFAKLPTAHRLGWTDWDGKGTKELVVVPILGPGATPLAYASPLSIANYALTNGTVHATLIDRSLTVAHGMAGAGIVAADLCAGANMITRRQAEFLGNALLDLAAFEQEQADPNKAIALEELAEGLKRALKKMQRAVIAPDSNEKGSE